MLSLRNKVQAGITPQHIRDIVINGEPADRGKHKAAFWTRGRYSRRIKPEYAWTLLARRVDGNLLIPEEKPAVALPGYQKVLQAAEESKQQSIQSQNLVEPITTIAGKDPEVKESSAVLIICCLN